MNVVIYYAGPHGAMFEQERFKAKTLTEARSIVREMFDVQRYCAEWNIRKAWVSSSFVEAHIYGYCVDEHVAIILEDKKKCDYLTNGWCDGDDRHVVDINS